MTPERYRPKRPYEIFGLSEDEVGRWRVTDERLKEILTDPNVTTNTIKLSTNDYGEFIFITTSKGKGEARICMTFYGLGYHKYRERWLNDEWFWYQTPASTVSPADQISFEEGQEILAERMEAISPHLENDTQTETGRMFEAIADMTDDDAAIAEMQDLGLL